jgi:ABC-type uncharacterized transport system permease subunit
MPAKPLHTSVVRVETPSGWLALDLSMLRGVSRPLLLFRLVRQVRHNQPVIGVAWAVLQAMMVVLFYSLFFRQAGGSAFDEINPILQPRDRGPIRKFRLNRS